uniref:EF-hand domain-containing protein n=1 Tax=Esox lucius TaxID=8010 RepID=A0A3P8YVU5_ESOLU
MDESQQDQYEERLKEVFNGFDATGAGSLCPEELSALCQALHLEDATPTLLRALLQNPDRPSGRVEFDQFKNALILVLSTTLGAAPPPSQESIYSPEVQAKFVRGSKRYGRRSTPEFMETMADVSAVVGSEAPGQDPEDQDDSTVPRKREFEAEGQLHLWNPDEPSTPRGSITPLSSRMEDRVRQACEDLSLSWDECASHSELLALCDHLGLEVTEDVLQVLPGDEVMSVQAFASWYLSHAKPATPSASTPYRQLKRLHSSQPFDETGRRTSTFSSTIGMRLFSTLDDGTGFTPAEYILDAWLEEGIENGPDILQALDFDLEGKVNLSDLTLALENELHMTKNGTHQAALVSFKAEIRSLLEQVDRERREKEKIRSDLEKAERLKTQLATEVDEHHTAIERINDLNLRKLEEEHREKLVSVRSELIREMDQMQQQAGLQREELESEMEKIRDDETFLRDHLSRTVKESRRLEMELLDSTEKLVEAENQVTKLQRNLDNILKEKFGDLDPGSAEFFLQEERIRQLRSSYEEQCRELQDRIDELQTELKEYQSLGRTSQFGLKASLSEELESKSPGMESDPEEGQPLFSISLEAEMMLEQLKENHLRETEQLQAQLESKVSSHLSQKIREVEARFSGDQENVAKRFQSDISNLEKYYQSELEALTSRHSEQKNNWDVEMKNALQEAEQQRRVLQESLEQDREALTQDLAKQRELLERVHKEDLEVLITKNEELQKELESFISLSQTKEIELSRQLNDLHNRLQENLDTKDELLAQSEKKAIEIELLLNQAVEDFKQERAELQGSLSELEAKHSESISLAEKQPEESWKLVLERDELKLKIKELEMLLRQTAVDFELERLELQENISDLKLKLKECCPPSEPTENEKRDLLTERDQLSIRIQEIENELNQLLESKDIMENKETEDSNAVDIPLGKEDLEAGPLEKQVCLKNIPVCDGLSDNIVSEDWDVPYGESVAPLEQGPKSEVEIITESPHKMENSEKIIEDTCTQGISFTSDDLNVLVETSVTCGNVGLGPYDLQDDEVELIPGSPDRVEACPENTLTLCLEGACDDETVVDDCHDTVVTSFSSAIQYQAQDGDSSVEMISEMSEDIEVCPENVISTEACNGEISALPEDFQESQTSEIQAEDKDAKTDVRIVELFIQEEQTQIDDIDSGCPSDVKFEDAFSEKMEQTDASVKETGFDVELVLDKEPQDDSFNMEVQSYVFQIISSALQESGYNIIDHAKVAPLMEPQAPKKEARELLKEEMPASAYICVLLELQKQIGQFQGEARSLAELQCQYETATRENLVLKQEIFELQQKTDTLESILAESSGNTDFDQRVSEENRNLTAQANEIEVMSSEMTELQIRYEECICENAKLEEQNCRLGKRVLGLESKMHIIQDFQEQQVALVDEITRMREENCKLTDLVNELERQDEIFMALQLEAEEAESEQDADAEQEPAAFLDLNCQLEAKIQAVSNLEGCCTEFEKQNAKLRRVLTDLQDKSLRIHERMQIHRWPLFVQTQVLDESLQFVNLQSAHLKSDLRMSRHEKDALKQEVISLHKQLQKVSDKNQVLEMALHSSGYQSQHKKMYRDELARLVEQEQHLLRQENERLALELHNTKGDLHHTRERVRNAAMDGGGAFH